ncbi:C6 finger domain-containing protein [Colletotrichum asianum]|uniref:C6 finger domain-containing protein n=1 Tax=Colletotrichum asianum TaxID=702518 RepID=A0A8H3WG27_9PEZI|nr:C6 finger domain-containing protein [Colletotrichum asianum]
MRKHKKSRLGCRECKQRKVKCDETRPSCVKCRTAGKKCSYVGMQSSLPVPPTSSHLSTTSSPGPQSTPDSGASPYAFSPGTPLSDSVVFTPSSAATPASIPSLPPPTSVPCVAPDTLFAETYSLFHLDLLRHFQGPLTEVTVSSQSETERILRLTYTQALKAPYLMDELLAFAAAHKSTVSEDPEMKVLYQNESTRLQSRAISRLGITKEDVTEDNFLSLFSLSILLGQHVLFDIFSNASSLPGVLDKLVNCLELHSGIKFIVAQSMVRFGNMPRDLFPTDPVHFQVDVTSSSHGTECEDLLRRLEESDMSESTKRVHLETTKILQYLFDTVHTSESRRFVAVQEWPVRISRDYINLLQQRRPEALVIMGYYAVLLHRARDYWAVGDSGRFLIKTISNHLGSYWSEWLEWLNQELDMS